MSSPTSVSYTQPENTFLGSIKWYDSKKGFGFIKPLGPPSPDVFVHAVDIKATLCERPVLITGEYVQFQLGEPSEERRAKAINVTGIFGGPLLCDHGRITFKSHFRNSSSEAGEDSKKKEEADGARED